MVDSPRQRVISESTGLIKFNINKSHTKSSNKPIKSLKIPISPDRSLKYEKPQPMLHSPSRYSDTSSSNQTIHLDEDLLIQLATKQRELIEFKSQLSDLNYKIALKEKEIKQLEMSCKMPATTTFKPEKTDLKQNNVPTLSTFRETLQQKRDNDLNKVRNNIKKKSSVLQLNNDIWRKSINAFTTLKNNLNVELNQSDDDEFNEGDSEISDYGNADTSDFFQPIK